METNSKIQVVVPQSRLRSPDNVRAALDGYTQTSNQPISYLPYFIASQRDRILATLQGNIAPPYEAEIQPSLDCNLSCNHCIGQHIKRGGTARVAQPLYDPENMQTLCAGIADYETSGFRVERVKLSGFTGEPLLPKTATLKGLDYLQGRGLATGLFTNGVLMDETTFPVLAGNEYVHVSLDAGSSGSFDRTKCRGRESGLFERVMNNISMFAKYKARQGSLCVLNVGYVVNEENFGEIYEAASLVKRSGADAIRLKIDLNYSHDDFGGVYPLQLQNILEQAVPEMVRASDDLSDDHFEVIFPKTVSSPIDGIDNMMACFATFFIATIGYTGHVYPCDHSVSPANSFGDAISTSFQSVWEGKQRMDVLKRVPYGDFCHKGCDYRCPPYCETLNRYFNGQDFIETGYLEGEIDEPDISELQGNFAAINEALFRETLPLWGNHQRYTILDPSSR